MSIFGRLAQRAIRDEDFWGAWARDDLGGGRTASGVSVSQDKSLRLGAVYSCVRLTSETIGALPGGTFKRVNEVRIPTATPQWLDRPNEEITRLELFEQAVMSLDLDGNAYHLVVTDRLAQPAELWPLHPAAVRVRRDGPGKPILYDVMLPDGKYLTGLEAWKGWDRPGQILHTRGLTWPGHLKGLSRIAYARATIGLGLAAEDFGARWFGDSAAPSATLSTDKEMSDEQAKSNMRRWKESHAGRRHPAFLSGGLKYEPITITPEESQFLETRKFNRTEIAGWFGIPPHKIGDLERATFSNIEHQAIEFVIDAIVPRTTRLELSMNRLLPPGEFLRFNMEGLLRGDTLSRYTAYVMARNGSWMNGDEIRAKEDLPPIPDGKGQDYLQPLNMGPLGFDPSSKIAGTGGSQ